MAPTDESLLLRIGQSDEKAFAELVRRYEYSIAMLIRYSINNPADAEDVLQETLLDAWIGLRRLRTPGNVYAWLMQVARNRCRDYFRSKHRREVPVGSAEIADRIDLLDSPHGRHREVISHVFAALEQVPEVERDIARLFYIDGMTIAEIAERHQCPQGTVKRRLFTARDLVRQALGIAPPERTSDMSTHRVGSKTQPFPKTRPEIEITPLDTEPFAIDCREMRYWAIIPEVGQRALSADYDPMDRHIKRVGSSRAVRQARIHSVEGVEIELEGWDSENGWNTDDSRFYGRVLEDKVQWLAGIEKIDKATKLRTFLDEGFVWAYPDAQRLVSNGDLLEIQPDGSLRTTRTCKDFTETGAGYFSVRIGQRSFDCLRIVGLEGAIGDEATCITEAYIAENGRMVLMRHFCLASEAPRWGETTNGDVTITVDGHTFSLFRNTLTDTACGIDTGRTDSPAQRRG